MTTIPKDTQDLIRECVKHVRNGVRYMWIEEEISWTKLEKELEEKNVLWYHKYWEFKFENNNMYQQMIEEILDAINYNCYELIKIERLEFDNTDLIESLKDTLEDLILIYMKINSLRRCTTEKLEKHFNS